MLAITASRDITRTEPDEPGLAQIDAQVGGSPCQAYARVGRAKLREIAHHPTAFNSPWAVLLA